MSTKTKKRPARTATKSKPRNRVKQQHFPGMEPPSIPALDTAAERYYDAIRERLPFTQAEKEAKDELVRQIHLNHDALGQATTYKTPDGYVVNFTDVTQVKVVMAKAESNGEA